MTQNPQPIQPTADAVKINMKKLIRGEVNIWSSATVLANVAVTVIVMLLALLPHSVQLFLNGDMGQLVMQIVYSVLMFTLPFILAASASGQKIKNLINFKWKKPTLSLPLIMLAVGAAMVINILVSQFLALLEGYGISTTPPQLNMPQGVVGAVLYLVAMAIVPAIVEEFAFRGIILNSLKKYGSGYAIIVSAGIFGLMHGNIVQIPFAALLGLVLGYVAIATNSIIPCIIIHFLNNFMAGIEDIVIHYGNKTLSTFVVCGLFALYLMLGLVGFVMICKRYKHPFDNIKEKGALTVAESVKAAFGSAGFIIAIIYFGGTACLLLLAN